MTSKRDYQLGYSALHPEVTDPLSRGRKAETAIRVLRAYLGQDPKGTVLDVGGSSGVMAEAFARLGCDVTAIDIDAAAIDLARQRPSVPGLRFEVGDAMALDFASCSVDLVLCCHVYEHVPDAQRMMTEILRILKPGGLLYFSAGNRLAWDEPHYHLPLLSVLPRPVAHLYMRLAGKGGHYHEKHLTYWGLKRLVKCFERIEFSTQLVEDPIRYGTDYMVHPGSVKQRVACLILKWVPWVSPGYIWLLKKPQETVG
jgi:ubiquinone/menaquinone biosynthesis C-methylase UbiE